MKFLSVEVSPSWVLMPGNFEIHETSGGKVSQLRRGKVLRFKPLDEPIPTTLLPRKRDEQVARGILDTVLEAKRLDVEESVVIEFLQQVPEYGLEIIGVNPDGDFEVDDMEKYMRQTSADEYFCSLCGVSISARGRNGHVNSKKHKQAVKAEKDRAHEQLQEWEGKRADVVDDPEAAEMEWDKVVKDSLI